MERTGVFCFKLCIAVWNFKADRNILGGIPYLKFPNLAIVSMRRKERGISVPVLYVEAGKLQIPAGKRVKKSFRIIALFFCRRYGLKRIRINRWISGTVHKWKILVNSSLYQTVCMLMELHCSQICMCGRVCYKVCRIVCY